MNTALLHLRDVRISCVLGVYPAEREAPREIIVNAALEIDISAPATSDNFEHAVNYEKIESALIHTAQEGQFSLIECAAEALAQICLSFYGVKRVTLCLDKPAALPNTRSVAIEITRESDV